MPRANVLILAAAVSFAWADRANAGCKVPRPLDGTVTEYRARRVPAIEAVFEIGRITGVCFGVEALLPALSRSLIDVDLHAVSVRDALRHVLSEVPAAKVEEWDGIVLIRPAEQPAKSWLDYRIAEFESRAAPLQTVNNLLYMTLVMQADPRIRGIAGNYPPGDESDIAGPFREHNRSLRELLSLLLLNSRGGVWVAHERGSPDEVAPGKPFWAIVQYAESGQPMMGVATWLLDSSPH